MFVSKYGPVDLYANHLEWEYNINICLEKEDTSGNGTDSSKTSGNSCKHSNKILSSIQGGEPRVSLSDC
jgi:hypothetical protein